MNEIDEKPVRIPNRYASKHDPDEVLEKFEGDARLDDEIALLRKRLFDHCSNRPNELKIMIKAIDQLVRALRVQHGLSDEQSDSIKQMVQDTLNPLHAEIFGTESPDDI